MADINWESIGGISIIGGLIGYVGAKVISERRYRKHLVNKYGVFDAETNEGIGEIFDSLKKGDNVVIKLIDIHTGRIMTTTYVVSQRRSDDKGETVNFKNTVHRLYRNHVGIGGAVPVVQHYNWKGQNPGKYGNKIHSIELGYIHDPTDHSIKDIHAESFSAESQFGDPEWKTKVVANNDGKPSSYDGKLRWDISYYTPLGITFHGDITKDPKRKHEGYGVLIECNQLGECGGSKRMDISPKLLKLTKFKTMPQVKKAFKKFIDDLFTGKLKCQDCGKPLTKETIAHCNGCSIWDAHDITRSGYVCHHHLYTSDKIPPLIVFDDGRTLKTYDCKKHIKEAIWREENDPNAYIEQHEAGGLTISDSDLIPYVKYLAPRERRLRQRFGFGAETFSPEDLVMSSAIEGFQPMKYSVVTNAESDDYDKTYGKQQGAIRRRLKNKIMGQAIVGTKKGQWSARKSQELKRQYEEACENKGLNAYKGKKTEKQKDLSKWSKQDWTTKSGKPSSKTGERYLPKKAIKALTDKEYKKTSDKKRKDSKKGKQFSDQPKSIADKVAKYRSETFEAQGGKRMYCPKCKTNRTWNRGFKKQKLEPGENPYDFVFYVCKKCKYGYDPKTGEEIINWRKYYEAESESKKPHSVTISRSSNSEKKLMAVFEDSEGKKIKTTHFGQRGASDYTKHGEKERMERYLERHGGGTTTSTKEDWKDPTTAGSLSRWILWNKPGLKSSFDDYKRRFGLKGSINVSKSAEERKCKSCEKPATTVVQEGSFCYECLPINLGAEIVIGESQNMNHAVAVLVPDPNQKVEGVVRFTQDGNTLQLDYNIQNLGDGEHGFHVHEYGDLTDGCESACAHFNPDNQEHGGLDSEVRHLGDLGNIVSKGGVSKGRISTDTISLNMGLPNCIIGRMIIVHKDRDDLGKGGDAESLLTGNAGKRLGCGVIGLSEGKGFKAESTKTNEMDKFFEWIWKEKPTSRQTSKQYSRKVDYLAQRYSDKELKTGLTNAYEAGHLNEAKLFAAALGRQGFISIYQAERKVY